MENGATCSYCKRSAKVKFFRDKETLKFELVQTGGPDQPGWLQPKIRREK